MKASQFNSSLKRHKQNLPQQQVEEEEEMNHFYFYEVRKF